MLFDEIFISILTIEPNKNVASKLKIQISKNLKIPLHLIHVFVFPPEIERKILIKGFQLIIRI